MNKLKYCIVIVFIILVGCSHNNENLKKTTIALKPIKAIVVVCNNTKIAIDKSKLKVNKQKTNLSLPITFDNRNNTTRNDIIFENIAFFSGHGDNGLRLVYKPTFVRINPNKMQKKEFIFNLNKKAFPNIFTDEALADLSFTQIAISYKCITNKGEKDIIHKRY